MNVTIDLCNVKDRNELHQAIAEALHLNDDYGRNLDALYDVLTEPHELWEITFINFSNAALILGDYMDLLKTVFEEAKESGAAVDILWEPDDNSEDWC